MMDSHEIFLQDQREMAACLRKLEKTWREDWPTGCLGRLDCYGKMDLRRLGEALVRHGRAFIAEAERQEAEHEKERAA